MQVKYAKPVKRITIYDLADMAGVSQTCVSRALLDKQDIGEKTKHRIRRLAAKFDYHPDEITRTFVSGKTLNVGVAMPTFTDPTNSEFFQCFHDVLKKAGYSMIPLITDCDFPENELNLLLRKKIDGLILFANNSGFMNFARFHNSPLVFCANHVPMKNSVTVDRVAGTYGAVRHLIELGHRDFAYLCQ